MKKPPSGLCCLPEGFVYSVKGLFIYTSILTTSQTTGDFCRFLILSFFVFCILVNRLLPLYPSPPYPLPLIKT